MTAADLITRIRHQLRDPDSTQYTDAELLAYINKTAAMVHDILIDEDADIVRTGSGTITTVADTEKYDLTANAMSDFNAPFAVWIDGYDPMEKTAEYARYDYLGDTASTSRPEEFYLSGDYIGLLPIPDDAYTANVSYYPPFTDLALTDDMPFRGLFDRAIEEAVKMTARRREEMDMGVEASLYDMLYEQAARVMRRRESRIKQVRPRTA